MRKSEASGSSTRPAASPESGIPKRNLTLVDRHATYAHNDPNSAAPGKNVFLKGLVRFLRRIESRR